MFRARRATDTSRHRGPTRHHEVLPMPTELYLVFLLFAAVLAFVWFYMKRARNRGTAKDNTTDTPTT
jgi:hypothetical protein